MILLLNRNIIDGYILSINKGLNVKKLLLSFVMLLSVSAQAGVFQVRTQPLGFLLGLNNVELGYGVSNIMFVVGGTSADFEVGDDSLQFTEVHAGVDYMLTKGWYIGLHASKIDLTVTQTNVNLSTFSTELLEGDVSATGVIARLGYRWQWTSFFMELGGEFGSYSFDKVELKSSDGTTTKKDDVPDIAASGVDLRIGWIF